MSTINTSTTAHGGVGDDPHAGGLQRGLTTGQISMIGLSGALGTGLFLGSGSMIKVAGPGVIVSYTLTGLLSMIVVWSLAEMVTKHPVAGGFGAAANAYLGPLGGFVSRWNTAVVMCIAVGAEVTATASYLQFWWPQLNLFVGTLLSSALLVALNLFTVKLYGASEYWFSMIKVVTVVAFILVGLILIFFGLPGHAATGFRNLTDHGGFAPHGIAGILTAAVMAIFSFGGAENVSLTAAESMNPEKDIPRAAHQMVYRLIIFYVGAIAVVVALEPWTVSASGDGKILSSPFVRVLDAAHVPAAADIMNFVLIVAALSAANGCLYGSARMFHSLGVDGMAPAALGRTNAHGAPRNAVIAASIGMAVAALLALTRPDDAFMILFGVLIFGLWFTWLMIMITYVAYRQVRQHYGLPDSPVTMWGGGGLGMVGLVALIAVGGALAFIPGLQISWQVGGPYLLALILGFMFLSMHQHGRPHRTVLDDELAAHLASRGVPD